MACARGAGSSDLKMPEPTNTPSAPNCIMRAASAGVAGLDPADAVPDGAHVADGLDDIAGASLALRADHRGALADAPERLAQVAAAADERHPERALIDVVGVVGGGGA